MFNWYIPKEIKTVGKVIKGILVALILGGLAGFIKVVYSTLTKYYGG